MPKVKTLHVPRCGSQQSSSQTSGPDREQAGPPSRLSRTNKRGNKRGNQNPLKVKLPKLASRTLPGKVTKDDKTPLPSETLHLMLEMFSLFSEKSNIEATSEKEKAKLSVLRTISKMLEENQLIRQRLAALKLNN